MSKTKSEKDLLYLNDYIEDSNDIWLVFYKGGKSLSTLTFKIKGEFLNNERIYKINKGKFLNQIFQNINLLKDLIRRLLNFIQFISSNKIVHSDIKPDNILIDYEVNSVSINSDNNTKNTKHINEFVIRDLKVIDFGSAFFIKNPENFKSNTPEYTCPEICDLIERNTGNKEFATFLNTLNPWVIDMWSLGITILELLLLCPLWINYKCKIEKNGKVTYNLIHIIFTYN